MTIERKKKPGHFDHGSTGLKKSAIYTGQVQNEEFFLTPNLYEHNLFKNTSACKKRPLIDSFCRKLIYFNKFSISTFLGFRS